MVLELQQTRHDRPLTSPDRLLSTIGQSIEASQKALLDMQHPEGFWEKPLGADTTLVSDYVMLMHYLGEIDENLQKKAVNRLLREQLEDGGWNIYHGGPSELNATIKASLALQMTGYAPDHPVLKKSAKCICRLGGIEKTNSYTRFYLALFGLISWSWVPAILPEVMFLPTSFYFNIYEISSWSRAILVPMSIVWSQKPFCKPPENVDISMWWINDKGGQKGPEPGPVFSWRRFFETVNKFLQTSEGLYSPFTRREALRRAKRWMLERIESSEGLAAIYPAMLNAVIALDTLGYERDHPTFQHAYKCFMDLMVEGDTELAFMPCTSPVWNTAMTVAALCRSGLKPDHPALHKGADWLMDQEVRMKGDWQIKNPYGPASGWCFEFGNPYYPDCDDTAKVLMALDGVFYEDSTQKREVMERAVEWLLSMQNSDGGWGAFDVDNNKEILNHIPFADHNALLDPSTADVTTRVLECLGQLGYDMESPIVRRAVEYTRKQQEYDGAWYGRWGVNYIYGTWQVIVGLRTVGIDADDDAIQRGAKWLLQCQNEDGGWGESIQTYDDPHLRGQGESTASQTAWALMGLVAAGYADHAAVERGVNYLTGTQKEDGTWDEDYYTGTGFPRVFYLRYTMYRDYFPLMALGRIQEALQIIYS